MERAALAGKVASVCHFSFLVREKIAGNPDGVLRGMVDEIKRVVEETVKKLISPLRDMLKDMRELVDKIPQKLADMVDDLKDAVSEAIGKIPEALGDLVGGIRRALEDVVEGIRGAIRRAFDKLVASFRSAIEVIKSYIASFIEFVKDVPHIVSRVWRENFLPFIRMLKERLGDLIGTIKEKIGHFAGAIRTLATRIWASVTEVARKVKEAVVETWERVKEAIREFIYRVLQRIRLILAGIGEKIAKAVDFLYEKALPFLAEVGKETEIGVKKRLPAIKNLVMGTVEGDADKIRAAMDALMEFRTYKDVTTLFLTHFIALAVLPPAIGAIAAPAVEVMRQEANERMPVSLLSLTDMVRLYWRGLVGPGDVLAEGLKAGIAQWKVGAMMEGLRPLPSPGQIQEAFLRGLISEDEHDALLAKHGYRGEDIKLFKALYWLIPGPADLIRMAVREAFSPEFVERFKMDEGFPEAFAHWAAKQGLSREWALNYWRAHWNLPSVQQGFEMFHRTVDREGNTVISKEELMFLLRALDIMPFWREKLLAISYLPYTRVDVRRMYRLGILDEQGVYLAYRDLGYDDEKARNLTEFTIRYYAEDEKTELDEYRNITRSLVQTAYRKGVLSRAEAKERLLALNYRDEDAELILRLAEAQMAIEDTTEPRLPMVSKVVGIVLDCYKRGLYDRKEAARVLAQIGKTDEEVGWLLAISDYEVTQALKTLALETARENYVNRTWRWIDAIAYLGKLNLSRGELEALKARWDIEREARTRKPTEAQFRAMLYAGIIDVEEYAEELRGLGFDEKYVQNLVKLALARRRA